MAIAAAAVYRGRGGGYEYSDVDEERVNAHAKQQQFWKDVVRFSGGVI